MTSSIEWMTFIPQLSSLLPQRLIEEYEAIDLLVGRLIYQAEEQCRKLHIGTITWSPAYQRSSLALEYWLKRKSYYYKELRNVRQMIVLQNNLKIDYNPNLSLADIASEIKKYHVKKRIVRN